VTTGQPRAPLFRERLTGRFAPEAAVASLPFLLGGALAALQGAAWLALPLAAFGVFGAAFFRNPARTPPDDPDAVLAPADGKVLEVGVCELADGRKALRIGIFLSVFDVHVNRAPVAGRVRGVVRSGSAYFAAFRPEAAARNVQLALELETASGARVGVVQISGWIARRIVCHAQVGEWLPRGVRYGLIRFGSRTDVLLPPEAEPRVARGARVRGGSDVIARLPGAAG
jgi:phosphatidylserine decarboxylase